MERLAALADWFLDELPYGPASALLLVENLLLFAGALGGGALLVRWFRHRPVSPPPPPIGRAEIAWAASTVALNTAVTIAGLWLYRRGVIRFRKDLGLRALLDAPLLLAIMDVAMYALHRLAHVPPLYRLLHRPHHRYDRPRPLTLFVLSPPEALAFGGLWLVVITLYSASWLGMSIYLAINVVFGVIGHLGVEPLGRGWVRTPVAREIATSTFHAQHHLDPRSNFGFYTVVWDRLLGTLSPRYEPGFGQPFLPDTPDRPAAPDDDARAALPPTPGA